MIIICLTYCLKIISKNSAMLGVYKVTKCQAVTVLLEYLTDLDLNLVQNM